MKTALPLPPGSPLSWPLPSRGETAAFSHLERTRVPVPLHHHADCQVVLVARGRAVVRLGNEALALAPPEAVLVWPGVRHAVDCPDGPVEMFAVQVAQAALEAAAHSAGLTLPRPAEGWRRLARVTPLLRELVHQLLAHRDALEARVEAPPLAALTYPYFCLALVERLAREGAEAARADASVLAPQQYSSEYVERAVLWMRAHLGEPFALSELARRVGTSPRNLSRDFNRELGLSPGRYLSLLRLEEAARLLAAGRAPVKEVAFQVGYASVPRFNHAFRAHHGCTPLELRRRART